MAYHRYSPQSVQDQWPRLVSLLPLDLEDLARQSGALQRCRQIPNAVEYMRLLLLYAAADLSLQSTTAWAASQTGVELSGPGLFYRVRHAERWLGQVLTRLLPAPGVRAGWRLRLTDATVITGPKSQGTDWRVHVVYDAATGCMDAVEVTDRHGGEHLARWRAERGDLVIGDRGYGQARGIYALCQQGAEALVRINPESVRLCDHQRQVVKVLEWRDQVPAVGEKEWNLLLPIPPEPRTKSHKPWPLAQAVAWVPVRLIAARTPKGTIIWLLTTVAAAALPAERALELYRLRWQIELFFKRLKSLLWLDQLPTRAGPTARSWLLGRLVLAALVQKLAPVDGAFSPWGYDPRGWRRHGLAVARLPPPTVGDKATHLG